ncbi:rRNA-processing protein fcf2-like [Diospyros lotus]|uniref:rRNA-processing protein fcf2-like n=1 Tax=Diospyros lotus TaxID=55363 RepID=UPI002255F933|nr:rRNA-processing protein fcf2-like [Diospyros lotus]
MAEAGRKPVIGLSWEPKLPPLAAGVKIRSDDKPSSSTVPETSSSTLYKPSTELIDGLFVPPNNPKKLNKLVRKQLKDTAGKNWFDMPARTVTPELKKDLQLIKLRSVIDPKRHYKKGYYSNSQNKYFQVGTVIEAAEDFYAERLTKKERKVTLADELLSDHTLTKYRKRKLREIDERNQPGGVNKWKIKGKQSRKRPKQRRH